MWYYTWYIHHNKILVTFCLSVYDGCRDESSTNIWGVEPRCQHEWAGTSVPDFDQPKMTAFVLSRFEGECETWRPIIPRRLTMAHYGGLQWGSPCCIVAFPAFIMSGTIHYSWIPFMLSIRQNRYGRPMYIKKFTKEILVYSRPISGPTHLPDANKPRNPVQCLFRLLL